MVQNAYGTVSLHGAIIVKITENREIVNVYLKNYVTSY